MNTQSEIDDSLRLLGSAEAPFGMETRINLRLQSQQSRSPLTRVSVTRLWAGSALAASVALSAVALHPAWRQVVFHSHAAASAQNSPALHNPRLAAPAGGFGTASAVHVPDQPVAVQPTPVNQGRGHARSGRAVLPNNALPSLPRGVAAPRAALPSTPAFTAAGASDSTR